MALPKTIGRYEVLEQVGRGSMGVVYKARDPRLGRIVAIKTISFAFPLGAEEEDEFLKRFFHEAQIAGRLNHPNIVTIYDVSEKGEESDSYIAMELVTGINLHELIAGGGRLPLSQVADVVAQLASALDYAHQNGVVHRDIKPANILLTEAGQVKILDFGIARLDTGGLTRPGRFFGTPNYMAPEQVTGIEVDGRSDQFSLAVILYQLLTGEKPFTGESITAISYQVVNVDPPPPSKLNPSLRPSFDRVLRKALSKGASDRYAHCQELAEDLKTAVEEWKQATDSTVPRTLVSSREEEESSAPRERIVQGITFLTPRWSHLLLPKGSPQRLGWAIFLICLVLLASAPYLFYTAPPGADGSRPLALVNAPLRPKLATPDAPDRERARPVASARLKLTLRHRLDSGRVFVRIDGEEVVNARIRSSSSKRPWTKLIPVVPGERRVEVRLTSRDEEFDDIEGLQADFAANETTEVRISTGRFSGRLKMRIDGDEDDG
jgi:predicted Ser/Thr protein kinase